jgi:hypothetical protein
MKEEYGQFLESLEQRISKLNETLNISAMNGEDNCVKVLIGRISGLTIAKENFIQIFIPCKE